ncbi:MAG: hypothetical protein SF123_17275 [Chloroflexota bacterium]|nr:hypothetical protein [Chloroflexota bacterium]
MPALLANLLFEPIIGVLAQAWRLHMRDLFTRTFAAGYVVTDFVRERYEERERAFYVLSYNGPQYESFSRN